MTIKKERLRGNATLYSGDCIEAMRSFPSNSVDSCVTDPPYHLTSIVKRFSSDKAAPVKVSEFYKENGKSKGSSPYKRASAGFMGKKWDGGDIAFRRETWKEVFRVLKPGAHLLAFCGTRNYHRLVCAIEDAGFEVRDCVLWLYGSGFPKSLDISKAIDKAAGAERKKMRVINARNPKTTGGGRDGVKGATRPFIEQAIQKGYHEIDTNDPVTDDAKQWQGWGTALKPAVELICLARKPLSEKTVAANVLRWGTGALNIDACRIATFAGSFKDNREKKHNDVYGKFNPSDYDGSKGRFPANVTHDGSDEVVGMFPESAPAKSGGVAGWQKNGYVGGKYEPIERTGYDDNGGSAARFFYAAKAGTANVRKGPKKLTRNPKPTRSDGYGMDKNSNPPPGIAYNDGATPSRFFYTPKADADDRIKSKHPTVKPVDLKQYLCRLITPPKGTVLDPFAGTGTTGEAAWLEGFHSILIEREEEYQNDIRERMNTVGKPFERKVTMAKRQAEREPLPDFLKAGEIDNGDRKRRDRKS